MSFCFPMSESLMLSLFWNLVPFGSYSLSPRTYQVRYQTNVYNHNRTSSPINMITFPKLLCLSSASSYFMNQLTIKFYQSWAVHSGITGKGVTKTFK